MNFLATLIYMDFLLEHAFCTPPDLSNQVEFALSRKTSFIPPK